jgi:hypothetical protein
MCKLPDPEIIIYTGMFLDSDASENVILVFKLNNRFG